ncbi:DNA methyltransferase [Salinispora arenicola]|uniref:DNA methyltransferase n=1 Tax=Salinispora arenicola TaxID=168697 RepID=UPI003466E8A6
MPRPPTPCCKPQSSSRASSLTSPLSTAIEEFGLEGLRVIDPTCGSGHFLIGVFRRLLEHWRVKAPAVNDWELIKRSLDSVHGVDKNPFAAAIARFRLMVEAMRAGGVTSLDTQVVFPLHIAVGDSLLHGREAAGEQTELMSRREAAGEQPALFPTEEADPASDERHDSQHHYLTEDELTMSGPSTSSAATATTSWSATRRTLPSKTKPKIATNDAYATCAWRVCALGAVRRTLLQPRPSRPPRP